MDHAARLCAVSYGEVPVAAEPAMRALCRHRMRRTSRAPLSGGDSRKSAIDIKGQVRCGRLEYGQVAPPKENRTRCVIDASHPYAEMVSHNLLRACETAGASC